MSLPPIQPKGILRVAAIIITVVMIAVIAQVLRRDGPAALHVWHAAHVRWPWVAFAVTCALMGQGISVVGWRRLLRDSGVDAPFWTLARLFLVSNLGRYLPAGKAWQIAIVAMMAAEQQLASAVVAASSLFLGIVGVAVGAVVILSARALMIDLPPAWLLVPVAVIGSLLAAPRVIRSIPRLHLAIVRHLPALDAVTVGTMWALVWTAAASWVLWGVALFGLASAILASAQLSVTGYVAAWTESFLAGLVALVSPAGLGARESVMQFLLASAGMRDADAIVLVVVARVWVTVLDVVPAVIVLLARRWTRRDVELQESAPAPSPYM